MTAAQTGDAQAVGDPATVDRQLTVTEFGIDVDAAGAADTEHAFILCIGVDQQPTLQHCRFETECAVHAALFVAGEECLQGTMFQFLRFQYREDRRHADAVVGAQRRSLRRHPIAIHPGGDGISGEVVPAAGVCLRHHIHVALKYQCRPLFSAPGCRLKNDDIANRVH